MGNLRTWREPPQAASLLLLFLALRVHTRAMFEWARRDLWSKWANGRHVSQAELGAPLNDWTLTCVDGTGKGVGAGESLESFSLVVHRGLALKSPPAPRDFLVRVSLVARAHPLRL